MIDTLAWIPFVTPMPSIDSWWPLFLIPLAIGISMIYKAIRLSTLDRYVVGGGVMTVPIVLAMVLLALGLYLVVQFLIPAIPAS